MKMSNIVIDLLPNLVFSIFSSSIRCSNTNAYQVCRGSALRFYYKILENLYFERGLIYLLLFFCVSCTTYEEVQLPDMNTETPSYEEILEKKELLQEHRKELLDYDNNKNQRDVFQKI